MCRCAVGLTAIVFGRCAVRRRWRAVAGRRRRVPSTRGGRVTRGRGGSRGRCGSGSRSRGGRRSGRSGRRGGRGGLDGGHLPRGRALEAHGGQGVPDLAGLQGDSRGGALATKASQGKRPKACCRPALQAGALVVQRARFAAAHLQGLAAQLLQVLVRQLNQVCGRGKTESSHLMRDWGGSAVGGGRLGTPLPPSEETRG